MRVAVAGLGFGEQVHLPALAACPLTVPVALWHPRPERLDKACTASGLPGFSDFEALLADPGIEALVIATEAFSRDAASRKRTTTFMPSRVMPAEASFCSRSVVRSSFT